MIKYGGDAAIFQLKNDATISGQQSEYQRLGRTVSSFHFRKREIWQNTNDLEGLVGKLWKGVKDLTEKTQNEAAKFGLNINPEKTKRS